MTKKTVFRPVDWRLPAACAALALLAACGGGGGGVGSSPAPRPTPTPAPAPSPSPTPSPTPTPASSFITPEYDRSDGPEFHDAITAWQGGATGQGQTIAVIDSGIDRDSPEFAGRIHPDSQDVVANRAVDAEDQHGTHVALVAAAARDDSGILGIAFDATVLALRADAPGSCSPTTDPSAENTCSFFDTDIAAGVDQAIASGAKVINISLGGGAPLPVLRDAIARAAAQGIVVVVSAGNDGTGGNPAIPPDQPDPFAQGLVDAGNGNVIIAGAVDASRQFSSFSNRAGNYAGSFISALGENICCIYENGEIFIGNDGQGQFSLLFSGTSFSAPQVAGAVALLAQAFPNLTGREIVEILLQTARDAGDPGPDAIYGAGILDISAAFAPQGATSLAGTSTPLSLGDDVAIASAAMGDAMGQTALAMVVQDQYRRAYSYDAAARLRSAAPRQDLQAALSLSGRRVSGAAKGLALAFTLDNSTVQGRFEGARPLLLSAEGAGSARVLAARVAMTIASDTQAGFALAESAEGLAAQLQGKVRPAFLIADGPMSDRGFLFASDHALAARHQFGSLGVSIIADHGTVVLSERREAADTIGAYREQYSVQSHAVSLDRTLGPLHATFGLAHVDEDRTILGAYLHDALGSAGAQTVFLDLDASLALAPGWRAGAAARLGHTDPRRAGLVNRGSRFKSAAWSLDLLRSGVFQSADSLGLRLSQPLRVTGGGLRLDLPVSYDYANQSSLFRERFLALTPSGQERVGELHWQGRLWQGNAMASLYVRRQPGHSRAAPADAGVAIRWHREF